MTTHTRLNATLTGVLLATIAIVLTGCNATTSTRHDQNKNEAVERWRDTRSSLVLQMAQRYFDTGDLEQAEKQLLEAMNIDPGNPGLHLLAGRIALERGQLERAFGRFQVATEFDPNLADAYYFQGIVLERWQKYDSAYEHYKKSYDLQADNLSYLIAMSEMLVSTDRLDEAITLLEGKVNYFAQSFAIREAVGQLYLMKGEDGKAVKYLAEASILAPDDWLVREKLASARLGAGDYSRAINDYRAILKQPQFADRVDLQRALAEAYQQADRLDEARTQLLKITRDNPRDHQAWIRLGEVAWGQGDVSGTLLAGGKAMSLAPMRAEGYILTGLVWQKRGDTERALKLFDRAAELAPTSPDALILRGITLERAGQRAAARSAYDRALERAPDDERTKRLLAQLTVDPN